MPSLRSSRNSSLLFTLAVLSMQRGCGGSRSNLDGAGAGGVAGAAAGMFSPAGSGGRAGSAGAAGRGPQEVCSASAPPLAPATLASGVVDEPYLQVLTVSGVSASQ